MTEVLERVGRERVAFLQRESTALAGDAEGFLIFARENCSFVDFLSFVWKVMVHRLRCGGAPAKLFVEECELLLTLVSVPERFLSQIDRVWHQRALPEELAEEIYAELQSARNQLDHLARDIRNSQHRVAKPPQVSADPEELKQRIKQADERHEWLPLRDVITRMRQSGPSKQE